MYACMYVCGSFSRVFTILWFWVILRNRNIYGNHNGIPISGNPHVGVCSWKYTPPDLDPWPLAFFQGFKGPRSGYIYMYDPDGPSTQ